MGKRVRLGINVKMKNNRLNENLYLRGGLPLIASWGLVFQSVISCFLLAIYYIFGFLLPWQINLIGLFIGVYFYRNFSSSKLDMAMGVAAGIVLILICCGVLFTLTSLILEGKGLGFLLSLVNIFFVGLLFVAVQTLRAALQSREKGTLPFNDKKE